MQFIDLVSDVQADAQQRFFTVHVLWQIVCNEYGMFFLNCVFKKLYQHRRILQNVTVIYLGSCV